MRVEILSLFLLFSLVAGCFLADPALAYRRAYIAENNQAVELLDQGEFQAGIELLRQAVEQVPNDQRVAQNLLNAYLTAGQSLLKQQRFAEVAELLVGAQEFAADQRGFWSMRGYALLRLKEYDEAETDLLEARGMGDPDPGILYLLGELYYASDRMYEAFDVLESAQLHDSDNPAIQQMLEKVRRELAVEKEMEKEYGGHFVLTLDGDDNTNLGTEILEALEDAYHWVGSQLEYYPEQRVTVILYSRQQFSNLTDSPAWAGGLYDGKVRLSIGGISAVDERVRALLYHEYMHVVLRGIAGSNLPTWLNEGLAEYAEAQVLPKVFEFLSSAREEDNLFPLQNLENSYRHLNARQAALAYEQSYDMVRFLIEEYGWYQIRDLVFVLGQGASIDQAIEEIFGSYGLDYRALEERWREAG